MLHFSENSLRLHIKESKKIVAAEKNLFDYD